jgi:hypothetical protein
VSPEYSLEYDSSSGSTEAGLEFIVLLLVDEGSSGCGEVLLLIVLNRVSKSP